MKTSQILAAFPKIAALVVGDVSLDRWSTYDPAIGEPSRETGIPRLGVIATKVSPGAGGAVASSLVALHAYRVGVLGVAGDDGFGMELIRVLEKHEISTEMMVKGARVPTFTYTKLINAQTGIEDQPRVDYLPVRPLPEAVERKILTRLESAAGGYDVIFVSDQAETEHGGVVTPAMRQLLRELAERFPDKVFWADSRKRLEHFRKLTVKPNRREAEAACQRLFGVLDYQKLRQHLETRLIMATQGPDGVLVVEPNRATLVETTPIENPVDICGAGDSFSAGAALALSVTGSPLEAARFGNLVASITIMKQGADTAKPEEVLAADSLKRRSAAGASAPS